MTAGTSVMRTTNASIAMPTARPSAIGLSVASPSGTNAAKTANMMTAAAVTTRADAVNPERTVPTASARSAPPARARAWTKSSRMRETRNTS